MILGAETSAVQGLDHCNECGACCRIAPCSLMPDDVARIEAHIGRSLLPSIQVGKRPSGEWVVRMKPPCDFLDGNRCTIHEVKPVGGREFECWNPATHRRTYHWSESDLDMFKCWRLA